MGKGAEGALVMTPQKIGVKMLWVKIDGLFWKDTSVHFVFFPVEFEPIIIRNHWWRDTPNTLHILNPTQADRQDCRQPSPSQTRVAHLFLHPMAFGHSCGPASNGH